MTMGRLNFSFIENSTTFSSFCHLLKDYIDNPNLGTVYFQAAPIKALCHDMSRLAILESRKVEQGEALIAG